jgi:tetratricopeptide (TPR) repeat protein
MNRIHDLIDKGWQARRESRHADAERILLEAIEASRQSGSRIQLIHALKGLAHVVRDVGHDERALTLYQEAVTLAREEGDVLLLAHTVRHLGDLHRDGDRLHEANRCYSEAVSLYRTAVSPPALDFANALRPAALMREHDGDDVGARQLWSEAKTLYQTAGVQPGVDECSRHLAGLDSQR